MNTGDYRALMVDFCREAGLPVETPDSGHFKIGDYHVTMFYDESIVDLIFIVFDLGEIEKGCELRAYEAMLVANVMGGSQEGGVMGLHPATGRPVHTMRVHFGHETKGRDILMLLGYMHRAADELRATSFVPQPEEGVKPAARSTSISRSATVRA